MPDADQLEIRPLTPERFDDLAALFEEGGDPRWCWCTYFRVRGRDWSNSTAAGNRAELAARAGDEPPAGLLAYEGETVVGWMSLGPRETYDRLASSKVLGPLDDAPVWSMVCFVVGKRARGRGVARAMLDAAIDHARRHGATTSRGVPDRHRWVASRRPPTSTPARSGCSKTPDSRSSTDVRRTPRHASGRSCGSHSEPRVRHPSRPGIVVRQG